MFVVPVMFHRLESRHIDVVLVTQHLIKINSNVFFFFLFSFAQTQTLSSIWPRCWQFDIPWAICQASVMANEVISLSKNPKMVQNNNDVSFLYGSDSLCAYSVYPLYKLFLFNVTQWLNFVTWTMCKNYFWAVLRGLSKQSICMCILPQT